MSDELDKKLEELFMDAESDTIGTIERVKQAFIDAGWINTNETNALMSMVTTRMTGQEWYERFVQGLWAPPEQKLPGTGDDGESKDRFYRDGGLNFMYRKALEAAKKASGIE